MTSVVLTSVVTSHEKVPFRLNNAAAIASLMELKVRGIMQDEMFPFHVKHISPLF